MADTQNTPDNSHKTPDSKARIRKWAIIIAASIAAYTLLGFFAVPAIVKSVTVKQLSKLVLEQRIVTIDDVRFNPYTLRLELDGLKITQPEKKKTFAALGGLRADLAGRSLLAFKIRMEEALLIQPELHITRNADGSLSITDIIEAAANGGSEEAPTQPAENGSIFPVIVNNFAIQNGLFRFKDEGANVNVNIDKLNLSVPFTSTREDDKQQFVEPFLNAVVNGAVVEAKGRVLPFDKSLKTEFDLGLAGLDVTDYMGYVPLPKGVAIDSGTVGIDLDLTFSQREGVLPNVGVTGGINVANIALSENKRPLAKIPSIKTDIKDFFLADSLLELNSVEVDSPEFNVAIDKNGKLNWLALAAKPEGAAKADKPVDDAEEAPQAKQFTIRVAKAAVNKATVNYSQKKDVVFAKRVTPIDILIENLDTTGGDASYTIGVGPADGERIDLSGVVDPAKLTTSGVLKIARVKATDYAAFYADKLPIKLDALTIGAKLPFSAEFKDATKASLKDAAVTLSELKLRQANAKGATTRLKALTVSGINTDLMALTGTVAKVAIDNLTLGIPGKKGRLVTLPSLGVSTISFDGNAPKAMVKSVNLANLSVQPPGKADKALAFKALNVSGIDFNGKASTLDVKKVALKAPAVLAALDADSILNVQRIIAAATGKPLPKKKTKEQLEAEKAAQEKADKEADKDSKKAAPAPKAAPPSFIVSVGEIAIDDGKAGFKDKSISPAYATELSGIKVRVNGFSNQPGSRASFNVGAMLDGQAPFEIKGAAAPNNVGLNPNAVLSLSNMDLTALSPYTLKYVSHPLSTGKLSLDIKLDVMDRMLTGENLIRFNNIQLGKMQKSPDDAGVPIGLALALLTDRDGNGQLDVPLRGNLDDPKFRLGKVIFGAIMNMIYKVVTSPFALIGSVFGGGEDLENLAMPSGVAELGMDGVKKLDSITKALTDRPRLNLEISGLLNKKADTTALSDKALARAVATPLFLELQEDGKAPASVDDIRLTPIEYPDYLFKAYSQQIGEAAEGTTPEAMEQALRQKNAPTAEDLRELARSRAAIVRDKLIKHGIAPERIFIKEPEGDSDKSGVHMTLK